MGVKLTELGRRASVWGAVSTACVLVACAREAVPAGEPAAVPRIGGRHITRPPVTRESLKGPLRPGALRAVPFDYGSLGTLVPEGQPKRAIPLSLVEQERSRYRVDVDDKLAVLLDEERLHAGSWNESTSPLSFGALESVLGGPRTPMQAKPMPDMDPRCIGRRSSPRVTALSISDWNRDHVRVETYDTVLQSSGPTGPKAFRVVCRGTAVASATARAVAILPHILYAFRRPSSDSTREELVIIGPPSQWSAAATEPAHRRDQWPGAFTVLSIPIARGSSGSLLFTTGWREIAYFVGLYGRPPAWAQDRDLNGATVTFSIEVVWLEGEATPDARITIQGVDRRALRLIDAKPVKPPPGSLRPD